MPDPTFAMFHIRGKNYPQGVTIRIVDTAVFYIKTGQEPNITLHRVEVEMEVRNTAELPRSSKVLSIDIPWHAILVIVV